MTMQTSGAISIGQARNECGLGNPVNAGNGTISKLGGVGSGQTLAWHYWYGKSNLPVIQNYTVATASEYVDRHNELYINLRTGTYTQGPTYGDHGPHLQWCNVYPLALIGSYKSWSCVLQHLGGNARVQVDILEQPSPSNDYTIHLLWDDESGASAIGNLPGNLQSNGAGQGGSTSRDVTVLLTCGQ